MIQIKCGTCGTSKGYKTSADGAISLPASEEARLVSRGVAAYATKPIVDAPPAVPPAPPSDGGEPPVPPLDTSGGEPPVEPPVSGGEGDPDAAEVARLERMQRPDLEQMAADLGLDFSGARNKHELAVLIVAAGEPDGGEPPVLGAGDIVR